MPNLAVKSFSKRIGRRTQIAVLAVVAAPVAALTLAAPAEAAPPYTATACTYASNSQCLASGFNLTGLHANDVYAKNNNTLNEWRFAGSTTQISTHLGSVSVFIRKKVSYCYGSYGSGTCATIQPHRPEIDAGGFNNTAHRTFLSFKWNA